MPTRPMGDWWGWRSAPSSIPEKDNSEAIPQSSLEGPSETEPQLPTGTGSVVDAPIDFPSFPGLLFLVPQVATKKPLCETDHYPEGHTRLLIAFSSCLISCFDFPLMLAESHILTRSVHNVCFDPPTQLPRVD